MGKRRGFIRKRSDPSPPAAPRRTACPAETERMAKLLPTVVTQARRARRSDLGGRRGERAPGLCFFSHETLFLIYNLILDDFP